ncbi:hypothetical protein [Streptomyces sp. NPDC020607]|uniref:hypothetical protein n=1 Tax=Streptomyces sp. NPDC020607 TaxID=3365082 RepID=UPI0037AF055B
MNDLLPAFVDRLLEQGRDPGDIPEISVDEATGWLTPLARHLLNLMEDGMIGASSNAFEAHGFAHLPLPACEGRSLHIRLAHGSQMTTWPITCTSVVLTVAGTLDLEMYQRPEDIPANHPQYARAFGPEQALAAHPGTVCALHSSPGAMQVLAQRQPEAGPIRPVAFGEHAILAQRARRILERVAATTEGGVR